MAKLSFQFHAVADDIREVVASVESTDSVCVSGILVGPKEVRVLASGDLAASLGRLVAIGFTHGPPNLDSPDVPGFAKANPDALLFEVGRLTDRGLEESWMYAMSTNDEAIKSWRAAVKKVKARMSAGVFALNPRTGALSPVRGHRFAACADSEALLGTKMLPAAGNTELVRRRSE